MLGVAKTIRVQWTQQPGGCSKRRGIKETCDLDGGTGRSHLIKVTQDEDGSLKWERVSQGPEQGLGSGGTA